VTIRVGQVLSLDFRLAPTTVQLEEVVAQAAPLEETQTTENATNVTPEQIENLPSSSRNFLDLALLAPGVRVSTDRINGTNKTFASGALPSDNINVFIDGQSFKNDLTIGGVVGQDASRGNPFPRNAVQEFRIITNNFKAEYQKASSAIITAATKSGGNRWEGSVFTAYQNKGLVALDTFQRKDQATNPGTFEEPDYSRVLTGISAGGPLVRDKLFFFGAYEGNYQNRQGVTRFKGDPATWPPAVAALQGEAHTSPFRSSLGFAKLSYNPSQKQLFELTGNLRIESDKRRFGGQFGDVFRAFEAGENVRNNVVDGGLKHSYFGRDWLNEALVSFQWFQFNPEPFDFTDPGQDYGGIGRIGGDDQRQDLTQRRVSFRDDWTYSGFQAAGAHVIKIGGNLDLTKYKLNKQLNENPVFAFEASNNFAFPVRATFGFGNPEVDGSNSQLGLYLQDDWSPTPRFVINAGIRWDYESGMYNRDFVTPAAERDSVLLLRDSLFVDVDPARYFTDGSQRKAFTGAFQPRLGFNYALDEARTTTVFVAGGIFYDRFGFNSFIDETYRQQHPNYVFNFSADGSNGTIMWDPSYFSRQGLENAIASGVVPRQEIFLVPNDLKPPKSYQFSGGVRRQFGTVNTSLTYTGIRGRNGFSFEWAQLTLNPATNDCCISIQTPYENILVGNNSVRTWYDGLEARVDRPYRRGAKNYGWGAGVAYTLSWAYAEGGDLFSFPQVTAGFNAKHPIDDDQRHRVVVNWVTDVPFAFGIQFSGLVAVASGKPFKKISFAGGTGTQRVNLGFERAPTFKNVDLRLRKDFPNFGGTRLGVTGDLFNVFNTQNLGCFNDTFIQGGGAENPDFGTAGCVISDPRRFQLGFQYDF
jgi:TonB dependent receptor